MVQNSCALPAAWRSHLHTFTTWLICLEGPEMLLLTVTYGSNMSAFQFRVAAAHDRHSLASADTTELEELHTHSCTLHTELPAASGVLVRTTMILGWQVGRVRGVEVRAAREEGSLQAHQVADQHHLQLQQEKQERLQQLQEQEQQVCCDA